MNLRFLVAALLALASFSAFAQTAITSCGTISATGSYYLANDLTRYADSGECLNVTAYYGASINLSGRTIRCAQSSVANGTAAGITSTAYSNLSVFGGSITGCYIGVNYAGTAYTRVQEVDFSGNTYMGISGTGHTLRALFNYFDNIKGYAVSAYAIGVNTAGSYCAIQGNTFKNFYRQNTASPGVSGEGVGVLVGGGSYCLISNNWFENSAETGSNYGIWLASGTSGHIVQRNTVIGFMFGLTTPASGTQALINVFWLRTGINDSLAVYGPSGTASGNMFVNYETPIYGGISSGTNTIYP